MRNYFTPIFIISAVLFSSIAFINNAVANNLIYSEDFSSDPNWTTNNSSNYYWDSTDETYFIEQVNVNGGGYYSYYDVGDNGYVGGSSFILEWDAIIYFNDYASDISFGLFDSDLNTNENGSFVRLFFTNEDRGYTTHLQWGDSSDNLYGVSELQQFSRDTWYSIVMEYDSTSGSLVVNIEERDTGLAYSTLNASVSSFSTDMDRIGSSNLRSGNFQVNGASSIGKIDNVSFYSLDSSSKPVPEPATIFLFASGLIGLAGFRHRFWKK